MDLSQIKEKTKTKDNDKSVQRTSRLIEKKNKKSFF